MTYCLEPQLSSIGPSLVERRRSTRSLGQPPNIKTVKPTLVTSNHSTKSGEHVTERLKTVPFKELEKMIADLKKENFDLKLRLFHLEDAQREQHDQQNQKQRSVGTQTPMEKATVSSSSPRTFYTAFEASAEGIALLPGEQVTIFEHDDDDYYSNHNMDTMTKAFSKVEIGATEDNDMSMDKVQGWLQELEDDEGLISGQEEQDDRDDDQISPLHINHTTW
ncbi:predicted protein [Lichtheimia corymbifera JMRC:FSU:9682]|uniref:Centrosomin N-terminal motif 1 domain-containing protein n=1 Tax=Lichtheimia corymbifera JMRC:FSU:9682 TaxID=1263082 RepID=A0A068RN36_9FUNG|nr:predicted protein [Lichtheimia corymbifera JMRC:FSU:9682]